MITEDEMLKLSGVTSFNPVQKKSIEAGVLNGESVVVSAPTASGKTLIAELAILRCVLETKKKAVYIVPLRALASEKYESFKEKYEKLGIKVAISVGDYDSSDPRLEKYDVIIITSEKFDSLLRRDAPWLSSVGLVVADEIHVIGDHKRGPTLEILLTKLKKTTKAQFIALSATIKNTREIADWLDAKIVESDYRPVKLYEGVYAEDKIGFFGKDAVALSGDELPEIKIMHDTIKRKKQALVFVATRKSAEATAERIAESIGQTLILGELKELKKLSDEILGALEYPTKQCEKLAKCVRGGVAFHHAGLVAKQRKLIEDAFRSGLIKSIVATPTLCLDAKTEIWNSVTTTPVSEMKNNFVLALHKDKLVKTPVKEINMNFAPKKMTKITTFSGNCIIVTPNHRMLIKLSGKEALLPASECKKGYRIATAGNLSVSETEIPKWSDFVIDNKLPFRDKKLDKRAFYFIGSMLGDGYSGAEFSDNKLVYKGTPSIVGRDEEIFKEIIKFCDTHKIRHRMARNMHGVPQLILSKAKWLREFLVKCGVDIGDKKCINIKLLMSDKDRLKWLLRGLMDTDGWVEQKFRRIGFSNISKELIKNVRTALLRYGIITHIRNIHGGKNKIYNKIYNTKDSIELSITHAIAIKRFLNEVGFTLNRKNNTLLFIISKFKKDLLSATCAKCDYTIDANVFKGRTKSQNKWGFQKRDVIILVGKNGSLASSEIKRRLKFDPYKREARLNNHFVFLSRTRKGNAKLWKLNKLGIYVYNNVLRKNADFKSFFDNKRYCPFCKNNLTKAFRKTWRANDLSGDIFWDRIRLTEYVQPSTDSVYDIVLPNDGKNDHIFVANGFLVHNSMGMNLPAYRVIIRDAKRFYALTGYSYIPVLDYAQMIGRAGRPQYDTHGEAILVAKSLTEAEELTERYIMGEAEEIYSKLASEPALRVHVLALIASETCNSVQGIYDFFSRTLYGLQYGSSSEMAEKLDSIVEFLGVHEFITDNNGKLAATAIGKRVSELYIDPDSAVKIISGLKNSDGAEVDASALIELMTSALEMIPYLGIKRGEFKELYSKLENAKLLHEIPDEWDYDYEEFLKAFKTTLMICDWMDEATEEDILEAYGLTPGELHNKISILDWLFYSAQEIAILLGAKGIIKDIRKTRVRVVYGIKEELLPLVKLRDIGRFRARKLFNAGFTSIEKLREAPELTIAALTGPNVAKSVKRQLSGKESGEKKEIKSLVDYSG